MHALLSSLYPSGPHQLSLSLHVNTPTLEASLSSCPHAIPQLSRPLHTCQRIFMAVLGISHHLPMREASVERLLRASCNITLGSSPHIPCSLVASHPTPIPTEACVIRKCGMPSPQLSLQHITSITSSASSAYNTCMNAARC